MVRDLPRGYVEAWRPFRRQHRQTVRLEMLCVGSCASWSRNRAAVGRAAGSGLRAVSNASIKCRLTPGNGLDRSLLASLDQLVGRYGAERPRCEGGGPPTRRKGWRPARRRLRLRLPAASRTPPAPRMPEVAGSASAAASSAPATAARNQSRLVGDHLALSIRMLAGLTSRCSTPDAWAAANASAIRTPMRRTCSSLGRLSGVEPSGQGPARA